MTLGNLNISARGCRISLIHLLTVVYRTHRALSLYSNNGSPRHINMSAASPKKVTKKRAKPAGPSTLDLVKKAIAQLKDPKGSSGAAIKKQIAASGDIKSNVLVNKALTKGVQTGILKQVKGTGANGSFKLDVAKQQQAEKSKAAKAKALARKKEKAEKSKASKAKKAAASKAKKAQKKKAVKKPAAKKPATKKKAPKPKKAAKKPPAKKVAKKPVKKAAKKKVAAKKPAKK